MPIDWLNLTGRVAIVTGGGANGGNGHAIAVELAKAGADVFVTDADLPGAEQTVREIEALARRAVACRRDNGDADDILAAGAGRDAASDHADILANECWSGTPKHPTD